MSLHPCDSAERCSCTPDVCFASIAYLRIGSAHAQCLPKFDADHIDLLLRLCTCTLSIYEAEQLPARLQLQFLDDPEAITAGRMAQATQQMRATATLTSPPFSSKFTDQRWLPNLFVVILAKGGLPSGDPGYCYIGLFAHRLVNWLNQPPNTAQFSSQALGGIVLRNGRGKPSPFAREWMRQHFQFSQSDHVNLEFSRHAPQSVD